MLWEVGTSLAAAALWLRFVWKLGSETQAIQASTATAKLSHRALTKPLTSAGKKTVHHIL